tara:strand:+ start:107 stop:571 length:465 start_codon:yes stop_codon:yes gene_type:complete
MKRFRETGSMLRDPSKGSSLRRDLSKGASSVKTAFKKIKDAGKSLTRGTKDLSATRVDTGSQKPANKNSSVPPKVDRPKQKDNVVVYPKVNRPKNSPAHKNLAIRQAKKAEKEAKEAEAKAQQAKLESGKPKRRTNESITNYRRRVAKYLRENK